EKVNTSNAQSHNALVTYVEPLTKKIKLEFEYNYNYSRSEQNKKTQNYFNGEYSVYDSTLTNNFENIRVTNRLGLKFIYETKKHLFSAGAKVRNVDIANNNLITNQSLKQSVNNVLPLLSYMYKFSQSTRFNFRYTTSSAQPTINQLQPIPDNSNPNQVKIGNPNLVPTFTNNFNASFNSYKPVSGKYIWMNANFIKTDNAFANSIAYDSLGRTITKTENVNGNYSANAYIGGGLPFFSRVVNIQPNANFSYNSYASFINLQKNITKTLNVNGGLGIDINLDTISFNVSYNYDYNLPSSTLNNAANKPYSTQTFDASVSLKLPFKFLVETDAKYNITSNRAPGYNLNYFLWNASISKLFLKNENFILTISGNDILNQNISTSRVVQDNVITDNKTNIISRYFLLKLTYKFNSTKTKDSDEDGMF
ncbi:MAG: outer membrane beta-barrel protein, partial [Bacteroidia bacterium]